MANSTSLSRVSPLPAPKSHAERTPGAFIYWHLLSFDAPTVAMLWTWLIAHSHGIKLPPNSILAMGVAVWILYATDRLLDARNDTREDTRNDTRFSLEPRHLFHRQHRQAFQVGIVLAAAVLLFLIPRLTPSSLSLYATLAAPLIAYFALIHLRRQTSASPPAPRIPKEIAVGIFFSAATFIPTVARAPALRVQLLPSAILFGLVCSLNCLFIYAWEHPVTDPLLPTHPEAHPATRLALRFLLPIASLATLACIALLPSASTATRPLLAAIALASAFLLALHRCRLHLDATTLRAAADLCLLTPLLFAIRLPS